MPTTSSGLQYRRVDWKYVTESVASYETRVIGHDVTIRSKRKELLAWLSKDGVLQIGHGYGWDGPSGPAIDTESFIDASLVHDCLYQMIELDKLPMSARKLADLTMRDIAKKNGMGGFRRWYTYMAVRWFGKGHAMK